MSGNKHNDDACSRIYYDSGRKKTCDFVALLKTFLPILQLVFPNENFYEDVVLTSRSFLQEMDHLIHNRDARAFLEVLCCWNIRHLRQLVMMDFSFFFNYGDEIFSYEFCESMGYICDYVTLLGAQAFLDLLEQHKKGNSCSNDATKDQIMKAIRDVFMEENPFVQYYDIVGNEDYAVPQTTNRLQELHQQYQEGIITNKAELYFCSLQCARDKLKGLMWYECRCVFANDEQQRKEWPLQEAFNILEVYPTLASTPLSNQSYPVFFMLMSGFPIDIVHQVYDIYPPIMWETSKRVMINKLMKSAEFGFRSRDGIGEEEHSVPLTILKNYEHFWSLTPADAKPAKDVYSKHGLYLNEYKNVDLEVFLYILDHYGSLCSHQNIVTAMLIQRYDLDSFKLVLEHHLQNMEHYRLEDKEGVQQCDQFCAKALSLLFPRLCSFSCNPNQYTREGFLAIMEALSQPQLTSKLQTLDIGLPAFKIPGEDDDASEDDNESCAEGESATDGDSSDDSAEDKKSSGHSDGNNHTNAAEEESTESNLEQHAEGDVNSSGECVGKTDGETSDSGNESEDDDPTGTLRFHEMKLSLFGMITTGVPFVKNFSFTLHKRRISCRQSREGNWLLPIVGGFSDLVATGLSTSRQIDRLALTNFSCETIKENADEGATTNFYTWFLDFFPQLVAQSGLHTLEIRYRKFENSNYKTSFFEENKYAIRPTPRRLGTLFFDNLFLTDEIWEALWKQLSEVETISCYGLPRSENVAMKMLHLHPFPPKLKALNMGPNDIEQAEDLEPLLNLTIMVTRLLQETQIEGLFIGGMHGRIFSYFIDIPTICESLKDNKTLKHLKLCGVIMGGSEQCASSFLSALKTANNSTLERIFVFDQDRHYTVTNENESYLGRRARGRRYARFWTKEAFELHFLTRLNRFGRRNMREGSTIAEVVGSLSKVDLHWKKLYEEDKGYVNKLVGMTAEEGLAGLANIYKEFRQNTKQLVSALHRHNDHASVLFGLFREFPPAWCHHRNNGSYSPKSAVKKRKRAEPLINSIP